ncbi:MAG: hypothetical protein JSW65_02630 [Candidatus Bipolaricaulota bacterium]|nr:MAG: hypothetical protein JSW65_02630 [Candidatus Bipolaricaulota bacterium]
MLGDRRTPDALGAVRRFLTAAVTVAVGLSMIGASCPSTETAFTASGTVTVRFEGIRLVAEVSGQLALHGELEDGDGRCTKFRAQGPLRARAGRKSPLATAEGWAVFDLSGTTGDGSPLRVAGGLVARREGLPFAGGLGIHGSGTFAAVVCTPWDTRLLVGALVGEGRGRLVPSDQPGTLQAVAEAGGALLFRQAVAIDPLGEAGPASTRARLPFDLGTWPAELADDLLVLLESCLGAMSSSGEPPSE